MRDLSLPRASSVPRPARPAPRRALRLLLCALLPGSVACNRWEVQPAVPRPVADAPRWIGSARVLPDSGGFLLLREVRVTRDSVIGWRRSADGPLDQVALARSEVRSFEVRRFNLQGTTRAVVLVLAASIAAFLTAFPRPLE